MAPRSGGGVAAEPATKPGRSFEVPPSLLAFIALALVILWLARNVLEPFVVAAVLAYAFSPLVSEGEKRTHLPRVLLVGIGYAIGVVAVAVIGYFVAGQAISELQGLAASGPDALASAIRALVGSDTIAIAGQQVTVADIESEIRSALAGILTTPGEALHLAGAVGATALQAVLVLIVTFYMLVDGRRFRDWSIGLLPRTAQDRTLLILERIHEVLGKWLRGQLLLVGLVAAAVYIVLGPFLHLHYALAIGVLTGVLEVIPLIGPFVATAIAAIIALTQGGAGLALLVIAFYFVLRQIEDQVVMPMVIGRAVHLHPVVTIFAVLAGLSAFGILGGLLAVPAAAALNVIFGELYPYGQTATTSSAGPAAGDIETAGTANTAD